MKNLKSILKKLTLILLASFLLVGSPNLLAMATNISDLPGAVSDEEFSIVAGSEPGGVSAIPGAVDDQVGDSSGSYESDSDTESEYSDDEQEEEKREISFVLGQGDNVTEIPLSENFNPNVSGYISSLVMFSGSEVEIKIDEISPGNIRRVCNETIIKKFINYLEKVSENTSLFMLRSDLEDETPDDFKALAVLANFFDVNFLMHACAPRCVETITSSENLDKFKKDPTMNKLFVDSFPGCRWLGFPHYNSYFEAGFDYKEVCEKRFESSVKQIEQSRCGNFVFVLLVNKSLKILKRDNETGEYVELGSYDNAYDYKVSADGKTICVRYNYNIQQRTFLLKILGWTGIRFVELGSYDNAYDYEVSADGKTICVRYNYNIQQRTFSLKILGWTGIRFVESETYEDVYKYEMSAEGKTICVRYNYNIQQRTFSLKILGWTGIRFVESETYEDVDKYEMSADGKMVCVRFEDDSLKILRWDGSKFVELVTYENIYCCEFSSDGKMVCVRFRGSSLKILRWDGSEFVEHPVTCENVGYCEASKDGKTVCVKFNCNRYPEFYSLKILRWDGSEFVEHLATYENVGSFDISSDGKTVCVRCDCNRESYIYTLKILRCNRRRFVEYPETYENVMEHYISEDCKTVCVKFWHEKLKIFRLNGGRIVEYQVTYYDVIGCKISSDFKTVSVEFNDDSLKILRWNGSKFVAHPKKYKRVSIYEISSDGNTVWISFGHNRLEILRWDGSRFVENQKIYDNVHSYKISEDYKTVCINFGHNLLEILRFNGIRFVEYPEIYENVVGYKISEDGNTVCVRFVDSSLKILRWDGSRFVESETYENVFRYKISADGKMVCIGFGDGRFKILRKYPEVKNISQAMFVSLAKKECESGGLDLTKKDNEEQNTTGLLQILGSFDETTRNYLIEKYNIKVDPQNIKQVMFLKLAVKKHNSVSQTGLDLTSDSEEQNTTDLLETFRSMPQETQQGLVRDWKVKVPAAEIIMSELGLEQVEVGAESETDVEDAQESTKSKLGRIGRRIMTQIVRCNCCAVPQEDS